MSTSPVAVNGGRPDYDNHLDATIDVHFALNRNWAAIDLDELRAAVEAAGGPSELVVTYRDRSGRRRYIERTPRRNRREMAA